MRTKGGVVLLLLLLLCISCKRKETACSHVVQSEIRPLESPVDAAELLRRVAARYGQLASYSDTGCVLTSYSGKLKHSDQRPFETLFVRPSTFRFEYNNLRWGIRTGRFVVWTADGAVRSWWSARPKTEHFKTISDALIGGVSGGSGATIPRLLLGPDSSPPWIMRLSKARVRGMQRLPGGTDCYVVAGESSLGPVQLWVERTTLTIHRVHETFTLRNGTVVDTTIFYQPRLNPRIDPARIRFEPPRKRFDLSEWRGRLECKCS